MPQTHLCTHVHEHTLSITDCRNPRALPREACVLSTAPSSCRPRCQRATWSWTETRSPGLVLDESAVPRGGGRQGDDSREHAAFDR